MFLPMLLLVGLRVLLASGPGSQNPFLQIIVPEKIQENTSDNLELENEWISYIITIDQKLYTIHLKQRIFLAHNFMVYVYNQGFVNSHPSDAQAQCYYQGYVEGYPNSVVTLSTCTGLRGILQFENVSYGIEPLESVVEFQHLIYKLRDGNNEFAALTKDNRGIEQNPVDYNIIISEKSQSTVPDLIPLYLEMHIVVDKALYDYLGSESMIVTNKIIEIIGLVNAMFAQFKVTIVLSSLELWSDNNKISTVGEADEVLHRFLEWKKSYLSLRPHDIAYLFIYRNYPDYVGAAVPGKMCVTHFSAGIAMQCGKSSCCNFRTCTLKSGAQCGHGLCCKNCQIERQGVECRKARHRECDIAEFCNGSSPECQPDMTIHNGHVCKQKYVCYDGVCQDTDARCEVTFGKGSKNAPFACYEEIQSHADRFGNCGKIRGKFQSCSWRNLQCGRLICTYPTRIPFRKENGAVIYAFVRNNLCITIDYRLPNANQDPMKVSNGSHCDEGRICVNGECVESRIIKSESSVCSKKCNGHGVCTSNKTCHCFEGYQPPFCETRGREASSLPEKQGLIMERAFRKAEKNRWLLGFYIALPILIIATIIAIVSWKSSKKWFTKEEESLSSELEGSTHTYASRSRSESSSQTDTVRSSSESSAQTYTSRSKSQESIQTHNSSN
ncbi:disintegrin and metalloproteinase domain-containing protein 32 isoform X3 [Neofelis nebulosa]|uniref:disintegrin and metalloproteinase domain-containing protein 32 isoform X3 n=1 Tax=Neofelis nebulosa TaxID=61452 RepID=UPI0027297247|nr:disintegrin and metalloproteinase domain-containing protein 32 isoform X3 [Neofelis nebulosa]